MTGTLAKFKSRLNLKWYKSLCARWCPGVQTAAVTIISDIPLSDLRFARYTLYRTVLELHALSPFGVYQVGHLQGEYLCEMLQMYLTPTSFVLRMKDS